MRTRTTRTRRLLAAATLAALPLAAGAPHVGTMPAAADAAHATHVSGRPSGPQWAWATGRPFTRELIRCLLNGHAGWGYINSHCAARAL